MAIIPFEQESNDEYGGGGYRERLPVAVALKFTVCTYVQSFMDKDYPIHFLDW